uniref:ALMS motif domain-containing protein n=1 Tax=Knipowitschia caucasica TaxID=637954 RepID=A0AAV2JHK9_KNICA
MDSSQAEHVAVKSGHVSQVRLLLSPKPMDHSSSAFTRDVSLPQRHFVPLRHSPSTPSSPDEGVGLSSPPEWQEVPKRGERFESNRRFMHQLGVTSAIRTSPQTVDAAIVPHLLPYKPNGSEELFYVPQTEADSSNDTTMESTHTGSDDALPPRFSNDVLGHQDRGLDRGVTLRHSEGIYSKRLHKAGVSMSQQQQRDAVNYPLPLGLQLPQPSSPALTRKLSPDTELPTASRRDQGTSPLSFLIHQFPKTQDSHKHHHPDPIRNQPPSSSKRNISDLDQLWERFSERWRREEESRPRDDTGSGYGPDLELSSPAERDVSVVSVSSTSVSTVDTARLIRAFGPERIQRNLRSSSSLSKLYSAISKQKEQEQQNTATTETSTEDSSVVGSASSNSSYKLPPHRGPSKSLVSRKAVKLVSKGIQAGDLEIVSNGTRRHTRDVGTTFPSPGDVRGLRGLDRRSASSKKHESQSSPSKPYPHGVSWFISADELKAEARKENEPEDWRPSTVWFELLSRKPVWREPLRQRPVEEQRNTLQTENEPRLKGKTSSAVSRANLQDALLSGRPDFVARSRQRLERLALQAEERRLQALFQQERDELFIQAGGARRLPRPAGIAQLRRAVPRKEMFQRSKQIYENLPEVRRRREEQRRKAEYSSYRLNAQLYNKRITNHVLSRRSAWS